MTMNINQKNVIFEGFSEELLPKTQDEKTGE